MTVLQHGVETDRITVHPNVIHRVLTIPLRSKDGFCDLVFQMPTESATAATPGDLRLIGLRFNSATYVPGR